MTPWRASGFERPRFSQRLGVRLAALLGLGAVLSALLAMAAMLALAWSYADRDSTDEAHQIARSVAFALQAPVSFSDAQGIKDAVAVLKTRPQIQGAWVHDPSGRLLHAVGAAALRPGQDDLGGLAAGWLQVGAPSAWRSAPTPRWSSVIACSASRRTSRMRARCSPNSADANTLCSAAYRCTAAESTTC